MTRGQTEHEPPPGPSRHAIYQDVIDAPAHFPLAPDWVCEVLSASTRKVDRKG